MRRVDLDYREEGVLSHDAQELLRLFAWVDHGRGDIWGHYVAAGSISEFPLAEVADAAKLSADATRRAIHEIAEAGIGGISIDGDFVVVRGRR